MPKKIEKIKNYQIEYTIGKGGYGKVKLATHTITNQEVAIKILEKSAIKNEKDIIKINREIKMLKQLNHPNIIKLYEIVETQNKFYLIMEYSEGGSLYNYITAARRIKEEKASFLFYQLIIGLKELHKNKICHRDLKPENLLLSSLLDNLKISDFGLSNFLPNNNLLSTKCGSPNYIAPEMITKKEYNGIFIDIWSCGIILYAMIFGFLPFDDEYYDDLFTKIKKGHVNFYHKDEFNISSDCIDLIKKILKVNPKDRISINDILKHPFINKFYTSFHLDNYLFGNNEKDIDNKIIDYMIKVLKIHNDSHFIEKNIQKNKHNNITTTFRLLKIKFEKGKLDFNNMEILNEEKRENNIKENNIEENNIKENNIEENNNKENNIKENNIKENNIEENNIKETNIEENNIEENNIKENNIKENYIEENNIKETNNKENNIKENNIEENNIEENNIKETNNKENNSEENNIEENNINIKISRNKYNKFKKEDKINVTSDDVNNKKNPSVKDLDLSKVEDQGNNIIINNIKLININKKENPIFEKLLPKYNNENNNENNYKNRKIIDSSVSIDKKNDLSKSNSPVHKNSTKTISTETNSNNEITEDKNNIKNKINKGKINVIKIIFNKNKINYINRIKTPIKTRNNNQISPIKNINKEQNKNLQTEINENNNYKTLNSKINNKKINKMTTLKIDKKKKCLSPKKNNNNNNLINNNKEQININYIPKTQRIKNNIILNKKNDSFNNNDNKNNLTEINYYNNLLKYFCEENLLKQISIEKSIQQVKNKIENVCSKKNIKLITIEQFKLIIEIERRNKFGIELKINNKNKITLMDLYFFEGNKWKIDEFINAINSD